MFKIKLLIALFITGSLLLFSSAFAKKENHKQSRVQALYNRHENKCIQKGWNKITIEVNDIERKILWKSPKGCWKNGAIIALHGGGGTYSNFGSNIRIGKPMIEFSRLTIKEGFAFFSLDSTDSLIDAQGLSMGKRWDCLPKDNKANVDLPFIETVITELIPQLRTESSARDIFITGISNGGYMTILAATYFDDKITAFAPVSCGDPYGTYMDGSIKSPFRKTPGIFRDNETHMPINKKGACRAKNYLHEKIWATNHPSVYPSFKLFYHKGDRVCDISCKEKVEYLLVEHGYINAGSFVIKNFGRRSPIKHFWLKKYNRPIIKFFKESVKKK